MSAKPVVLFVEDDADDARLTLMALGGLLAPYEVVMARDGVEALEHLARAAARPALIILDVNLPRVSGVQLLERLNRDWGPALGGVKVAVLSSSYIETERAVMLGLGAAVHLRKPVRPDETQTMLREFARLLGPAPG